MEECVHYIRKCSFITPCCQKVYRCRFCHDNVEDHELNRALVNKLQCAQCRTEQPLSTHCCECGIRFGMYTCLLCRLFDDADKQQFHCDKCQTCRVGGEENFFHCDKCEICLGKHLLDTHKCRAESGKDNCPVCFENVHTATEPAYVPQCSHLIHFHCYKLIEKFGHKRCPVCSARYEGVLPHPSQLAQHFIFEIRNDNRDVDTSDNNNNVDNEVHISNHASANSTTEDVSSVEGGIANVSLREDETGSNEEEFVNVDDISIIFSEDSNGE